MGFQLCELISEPYRICTGNDQLFQTMLILGDMDKNAFCHVTGSINLNEFNQRVVVPEIGSTIASQLHK